MEEQKNDKKRAGRKIKPMDYTMFAEAWEKFSLTGRRKCLYEMAKKMGISEPTLETRMNEAILLSYQKKPLPAEWFTEESLEKAPRQRFDKDGNEIPDKPEKESNSTT